MNLILLRVSKHTIGIFSDSHVKYSTIQVEVQGECKDQKGSCPYWASIGLCESNHGYMINQGNCLKTCGVCAGGKPIFILKSP